MQCSKQESKIHSFNCKGGVQKFLLNRLNDTYSGIPDVVHDELDFVLVLGRPGGRDVDHPGEELRTVRYHVEIQLPSEEEELVTLSVWDNSHLVKMAADLSITSACLNCLLRSLAMGLP